MPFSTPTDRRWRRLLTDFLPDASRVTLRECLRIMLGSGLTMGLVILLSQWVAHQPMEHYWLGASIAASTFLIFALPSSPLAQPWAVLVGNLSAAAVGMACAQLAGSMAVASTLSVPLSILVMILLRAVHPPGVALAFYMVLQQVHEPHALLFPLGFNFLLIVVMGALYNHATGRRYPHRQRAPAASPAPTGKSVQISQADVDRALARYNEVLAISRADLTEMMQTASGAAYQRHLGELRCGDAMRVQVDSAPADLPLAQLGELLRRFGHRELPVVDTHNRLLGSIGLAQWLDAMAAQIPQAPSPAPASGTATDPNQAAAETAPPTFTAPSARAAGLAQRLWRQALRLRPGRAATRPKPPLLPAPQLPGASARVRDAMLPSLVIAAPDQPLREIVPVLSQGGRYHVPVVDAQQQLLGIITQTDLLRALDAALPDAASAPAAPQAPESAD